MATETPKYNRNPTSQSYDPHYEQDPRYRAVDDYVNAHLSPAAAPHTAALDAIYQASLAAGLPDIACPPAQSKLLMLQVRMAGATRVLEVGTLGGYSAAWMASAAADVRVTTLEISAHNAAVARANLAAAGLAERVDVLIAPALESLAVLAEEVRGGRREPFEFVFIDANKEDNLAYFDKALEMTTSNATLVVDNVVRKGAVASAEEAERDPRIAGTRRLIEGVGRNERVDATVIQTVGEKNYDGFLLAVKKW